MVILVTCSCTRRRSCLHVHATVPILAGPNDCSSVGAICKTSTSAEALAEVLELQVDILVPLEC